MGQTIVQLGTQLAVLQVNASAAALSSAHSQQDVIESIAILGKAMAMQEEKMAMQEVIMAELRTRSNSRSNCIDVLGIHRSNFF